MLFPESDAPLLKAWIVTRLANNSDADADVLADYVLALLRHDGDTETIRRLFNDEIRDFLGADAPAFTDQVLQVVKYRSYMPGAPPPPSSVQSPTFSRLPSRPEVLPPPPSHNNFQPPSYAASTGPAAYSHGSSRKRSYMERADDDVEIILDNRTPYNAPVKQPRRGGGFGPRGSRPDEPYIPYNNWGPPPFSAPAPQAAFGPSAPFAPYGIDISTIQENIRQLQALLPQAAGLPQPVYSGTTIAPPRKRKQRCRDYDNKGFCARGNDCRYQHINEPLYNPRNGSATGDEYDPNNASLALPPMPLDVSASPVLPSMNRHESKKSRRARGGRAAFAQNGPMYDRTNTKIVVQKIPSENYNEDAIRTYFAQFGNIKQVSLQYQDRTATIDFEFWEAANAAYSSPKVIFDNRFVRVFWYKDEASEGPLANGNPGNAGFHVSAQPQTSTATEPEIDMEEFSRKQAEAQKTHEEKLKKRQEYERQKHELEELQKEVEDRKEKAKQELRARQRANGQDCSSSLTEIKTESTNGHPSAHTEDLRAQLAALEQEATSLGLDPDIAHEDILPWFSRGRGRGRVYRGRGSYPPRAARGWYGYRGRGGGVGSIHAAYAAYSLDLRPKTIALTGVDFTLPENDESLRQYLFTIGDFKGIDAAEATTHVTFHDRKTAEKFWFGVSGQNSIPGIKEKLELGWSKAPLGSVKVTDEDVQMTSTLTDENIIKEKGEVNDVENGELEDGEIEIDHRHHDHGDMDYEAGEW
ncbi:hypothetical protein GGR57DRAFT_472550 [Xylariaceae sp. FL1272]|nr:hypothetical protein GGR57DRAFT_472550 [Xylariaceae sp. FL1272]